MAEHNELGKWGEDEAALYLEQTTDQIEIEQLSHQFGIVFDGIDVYFFNFLKLKTLKLLLFAVDFFHWLRYNISQKFKRLKLWVLLNLCTH